ncbi:hypothetical protein [Mesomycoplasma ovipneumoniae]|uniref:hypothetical protein n=1 Tax=Mesomycoplasma ovipneumoniae TaxID=29562 RepID=UPI0030806C4F
MSRHFKKDEFKLGQRKLTLRCWLFLSKFKEKANTQSVSFFKFSNATKGEY